MMHPPGLEFAFELRVNVTPGKMQELGMTPKGLRRIIPIIGGTFEGPKIRGEVVPGGYDWQLVRSDGIAEIEARYVLKTDDGELITIVNTGLRHGPEEVMARLARGEEVDASDYYFRSVPVFETASEKYHWLTKHVFIASGLRKPDRVVISVYAIL
jgi:Protein of unknown function (DUF3237)